MSDEQTRADVERVIRALLAEAVRVDPAAIDRLPADTELFGPEIGLSSLAGVTLLTAIRDRYQVDVADEDLNLDSLQSIATLRDFVAERV
ncbi:acyl carrier protein [Goodfellowiella coeruleoviolacea]|uniref:Phosphopantetheine attachment site n=1 Tax=Goodfellowiella coeruleoviolacea TaxID=334858 RepID=A0AAE3GJG6_9PSEU|nr:phosphopantetheine-binding protein [Goodfellowiella coeruleoviolacea]MCP2168630.1 Phosphopantetheine attachment site [Goodfellowiella coeruleoviolacea]